MAQQRTADASPSEPTDRGGRHDLPEVGGVVEALGHVVARGGATAGTSALDVLEGAARALVRRVVEGAIADPRPVADRHRLAEALRERSVVPALGGATAAALGTKVARRLGPARFAARRTPLWLAVTAVPAVYASIGRGVEELTLVTSHLVERSRAAGVEPDPERLRRVVVQVLSSQPVDPGAEPGHGPLAVAWARRAVRATLPFASGVKTRDPQGLAAAAAAVDPEQLRPGAAPRPGP